MSESISADSQPPIETTSAVETQISPAFRVMLVQKNFLRGQQTFELLNDHLLRFQIGMGKKRKEGQVDLATLNPEPQRIHKWHIGSLVLAAPMVLMTLIILVASIAALFSATSWNDLLSVFLMNAVVIGFTALLVGNMYVKRQNSIVFASSSGTPITLWFENPDKKTFGEFLLRFQAAVDRADRKAHAQAVAEIKVERPAACAQCQSPRIVPGYATPLCEPCRNALVNRPLPLWLKIAAGALAVLMMISAVRIPRELNASLAYERGQIAEQKSDYAAAAKDYQNALLSYPKSVDILGALARAAHRSGEQDIAIQCVNQIIAQVGPSGEISKNTVSIINEVRGGNP
jgi:hypothetical protein